MRRFLNQSLTGVLLFLLGVIVTHVLFNYVSPWIAFGFVIIVSYLVINIKPKS